MNIREKREELGLSQKELAEKIGITQSFLCDIEQGRSKPSIDVAIKLAKVLEARENAIIKIKVEVKEDEEDG